MLPPLFTPPYLSRLEALRIRTQRRFLGSRPGGHPSPRRGAGLEFAEYRRYAPGDDLRYLDWNLFARTDKLYVKQFQEEDELYTSLFLDGSASMAGPARKFDSARDVVLSLAYVALAGKDAVGIALLGPEPATPPASPYVRGRRRFVNLAARLAAQRPGRGQVNVVRALARSLQQSHHAGKAVWVSDFLFPLAAVRGGLSLFRGVNSELTVIQVLGRDELDPPVYPGGARFTDSESAAQDLVYFDARAKRAYVARLEQHTRELAGLCHQAGVHYARLVDHDDVADFVLRELPRLGLLH